MTDDHGDRFPGALPTAAVPGAEHRAAADGRLVRMRTEYLQKANSLVEAGRDDLAYELAESFEQESAGARHGADRRTRSQGGRRPGDSTRLGRFTRRSLHRFDRHTLDVFNPGAPYRRSDR